MRSIKLLIIIPFLLGLTSCFNSKPQGYFNLGNIDTTLVHNVNFPDQVIQKGDLLSITIFSDNPAATAIFNQAGSASVPVSGSGVSKSVNTSIIEGSPSTSAPVYLVDNSGNIRLHALGLIKAEGLSKDSLSAIIIGKLNELKVLTNPYCVIRFSNFKVTVLGEVRNPGVFTLPGEKASILEAVGLAGDITDYGRREKVVLIREDQGKRTYHIINLLDPQVFTSPYFFISQNDVIVIQPDTRKPTALDQQTLQYVLLAASLASTAAIFITIFK